MLNLYSKNNSSESFKEINKFCRKNRLELIHSIGKDNGLMLLRAIENQISEKVPPLGIERELAMANNVFFAIDSLCNKEERLAIWAHTIHLRKTYFSAFDMSPSVGNFIQNKYGDNYQAITVLVGQGERVSYNRKIGQETFRLKQAPENSLEYCCSKLFNKHSDKNKSDYVLMRHGGLGEIYYSFYELPFRRSYDGLIYINESEPIQITK